MRREQRGFSLLEGLISLFLFLLIILFCLECFLNVRKHFAKLKVTETSNTAVYAALDRMRKDLSEAGSGLVDALRLQILKGINDEQGILVVLSGDENLLCGDALYSGQQRIPTSDADRVKKGQTVGLFNPYGGEVHSVISTDADSIVIDSPLLFDYPMENARFVLLRKISLYLDKSSGVIRRMVNASPAQPLLENVASFTFDYTEHTNLVRLDLTLTGSEEEKYETMLFPKNTAMASIVLEK